MCADAIEVRKSLKNHNLLLTGDVVTISATVSELAKTLKFCEIAQIYAQTQAHPK